MNQKEAVFQVVRDIRRGAVDTDVPVVLTKQEKALASQKLFEGFKRGRVAYNHEMPSDDKLLLYISGLVSNWLRKDKRLNGQKNYVPRRPGARAAMPMSTDNIDQQQLEALRTLAGGQPGEEVQVFVIKRPASVVASPIDPNKKE